MRDRAESSEKSSEPAVARRRSEGVTLACAVAVAVGLGVAAGMWVNARLTPTSSAGVSRPTRLLPDALASASPAPAAQPSPCDGCETSAVGAATPARGPADKSDEAGPEADSPSAGVAREAARDAQAEPGRPGEVANGSAEAHGATDSAEAVAATSPDPARPMAWQVGPLPKASARAVPRVNVERSPAQAPSGPCALYVSASSLGVRVGGAAPLVLGGPGAGVRINVSTPDWSNLAVIYEGPAAGHNGWLRYSVKSVSRRPGLYTVRVSSPCGSQTIPITVK